MQGIHSILCNKIKKFAKTVYMTRIKHKTPSYRKHFLLIEVFSNAKQ